jgi:hypothetical protein
MGMLGPKRHTQKTGDISEAAVITRLLRCGYIVLTPYGQNHRYDLVIEDADGKFWRVQVKTGWLDGWMLTTPSSNLPQPAVTTIQQSRKGGSIIRDNAITLLSMLSNWIRSTLSQ